MASESFSIPEDVLAIIQIAMKARRDLTEARRENARLRGLLEEALPFIGYQADVTDIREEVYAILDGEADR